MKVSVLGGTGFIGSHLVRRLVDAGHDVTAFDSSASEVPAWKRLLLEGARRRALDMRDPVQAVRAVRGADWVFHLAADMGGVGYFHSNADLGAAMVNGRITANVFQAVLERETPRMFYASSACCYPIELQQDLGEPAPLLRESQAGAGTPDALYGAEKLHGLRLASKVPGARVGILHTVYGPGQEWEGRRAKFPPSVARKALDARESGRLELWGDGRQLRSYLYVDDAVDRIIRVMEADEYSGPVNIGASGAVSCREVAEICLDIVGVDAEIVTNPAEPSGVLARDCDNREFARRYGSMSDRTYPVGFRALIEWIESVR